MKSRPPNILLLCPDEMKATALGAYGNLSGATPFLDRWAHEAMLFEQCHTVHPKCTPSRCSLVTAQYPHVGGHRTLDLPIRSHEINLIRTLRAAGYETCLVGKNHTVVQKEIHDTFEVVLCGKGRVDFKPRPGYPEASHYIGESTVPLEEFQDRAHTREAIAYLKNGRKDKPFFMWLNWNAPHPPYSIPAPYHGSVDRSRVNLPPADDPRTKPPYQSRLWETFDCAKISEAQWLELAATYLDMCRFVDDQVRDIFSTLEETGQRENTIVLLWSDHGDFAGEHRLPEKWDTSFYDCITRVPLILDIPGHAPARIGGLVESIDILPTVLALAGVEAPRGIQGLDLGPMIRGETAEMRTEVFCQGGQEEALLRNVNDPDGKTRPARAYWYKQKALYDEPRINARAKMIRDHRYKYCYHAGGFEEFYDLETDPHELVNLAVSSPADRDPIARYRQRLLERLIAVETVEPFQEGLDS